MEQVPYHVKSPPTSSLHLPKNLDAGFLSGMGEWGNIVRKLLFIIGGVLGVSFLDFSYISTGGQYH